jgi:hypothetical protein
MVNPLLLVRTGKRGALVHPIEQLADWSKAVTNIVMLADWICSAQLNKPFVISAMPKAFVPLMFSWRISRNEPDDPVRSADEKGGKAIRRRTEMTGKITAILAAAVVLASAGAASAQPNRHARTQWQAPYANSYYNRDYWAGIQGVAPYQTPRFDPYAGTVWDGVAPY